MNTLLYLSQIRNRKDFNQYVSKLVVYKITNLVNKKCYIGVTSRIKRRIVEHIKYSLSESHPCKSYLHFAISKDKLENFSFEVIYTASGPEELNEKESFFIKQYNSSNSNFGYNLTLGGERNTPNEECTLNRVRGSRKIRVAKYSLLGNLIESYPSVMEASRANSIPDTDIHRCHRKKWSRNGFMYRKFSGSPPSTIEPFESRRGFNFKNQKTPHNRIKCRLLEKKTGLILFEGDSLKNLANKANLDPCTIHRAYHDPNHKKWRVVADENLSDPRVAKA